MKTEVLRLVAIVGGVWCALIVLSHYMLDGTLTPCFLTGLFGVAIFVYGLRGVRAWISCDSFDSPCADTRSAIWLLRAQVVVISASGIVLASIADWVTVLGMILLFLFGLFVIMRSLHFQCVMSRVPYALGGRIYPAGTLFWRPFFGEAKLFKGTVHVSVTTKTWFACAEYPVDCEALPLEGVPFGETELRALVALHRTLIDHKNADSSAITCALLERGFAHVVVERLNLLRMHANA